MSQSFSAHPLQPFAISATPRDQMTATEIANWANRHRDLIVVAGFCAIGLIITVAVTAQLPDFSAAMAAISLIP